MFLGALIDLGVSEDALVGRKPAWYRASRMKPIQVSDVLELTAAERIQLAEDIWDSVLAAPEALRLTPAQKKELDRRLAAYRQHPAAGSPWADVKKRLLARK